MRMETLNIHAVFCVFLANKHTYIDAWVVYCEATNRTGITIAIPHPREDGRPFFQLEQLLIVLLLLPLINEANFRSLREWIFLIRCESKILTQS